MALVVSGGLEARAGSLPVVRSRATRKRPGRRARRPGVNGAIGVSDAGIRARVERVRSGDAEAFGELFRSLEADIGRLCRRLLGSKEDADDATSEVFLRARQGFESFDPKRPLRTWIFSIAAHHCVDRLRRRNAEGRLFESGDFEAGDLAAPGPSPLQGLLRAEARREVLAAVESLEDRHRAPLVLRYYAELDYEAIAEILGVTKGQVATLLFRAKRRLRARLAGDTTPGGGS